MVLAQDTPVMLFDEPTSFLDVSACYEVMELMRSLKEEHGKTVVAVIHDIPRIADRRRLGRKRR